MIQVSKVLPPNFETYYDKITGPTGPCVYPALHLWIHAALYKLTDSGHDINLAQAVYAGLYLMTLALVVSSYRRAGCPPWLLLPLILSKRMHSIFLLRMFNDCWATFFFWLSVYLATRRKWAGMTFAWVMGLNVKMTLLLPLPALAVVLVQGAGITNAVIYEIICVFVTLGVAAPFMGEETFPIYLRQAFDFGREFLFKWTVNWRLVGEETFLSKEFKYALLGTHVLLLLAFLHFKWIRPSSDGLSDFLQMQLKGFGKEVDRRKMDQRLTPKFVMDVLLGSMAIGLLCARSMHYQFYAYLGWMTPYLLWRSNSPLIVLTLWICQEYAWLVFPSTSASSITVVTLLMSQVGSAWLALPYNYPVSSVDSKDRKDQ